MSTRPHAPTLEATGVPPSTRLGAYALCLSQTVERFIVLFSSRLTDPLAGDPAEPPMS
jgi:hypothetical protein